MSEMQSVIPAEAGISGQVNAGIDAVHILAKTPAFAGVTVIA
jgi:hypothetical protein